MPWKAFGSCVHKLNEDGSKGEQVKCHTSPDKAQAHVKALYANVDEKLKELMIELITDDSLESIAEITKEDNRYKIRTISTAAIQDREGETFTTQAMDGDIAYAEETGKYPEYRVFHSPLLGIGMVEKMSRIGIFAHEEGYSYTDDFSLAVCEKMLLNNDGKWRVSRGFRAYEASVTCPNCSNALGITQKHMSFGFRCPSCTDVHLSFKGMPNVKYIKTRTFDITVTDVPAVPMTSASAIRNNDIMETTMTKKELKERLLAANLDEALVDARLADVSEEKLKEYDDIPDATLLKEFAEEDDGEQYFVLEPEVLDEIAARVRKEFTAALADFEFEVGDLEVEFKEDSSELKALREEVVELKELVNKLLDSDEERLKELLTPNAKNRLRIYKSSKKTKKPVMVEDDEEDEDEEYETNNGAPVNKQTAKWFKAFQEQPVSDEAIVDGQGNTYKSLTEMIQSP